MRSKEKAKIKFTPKRLQQPNNQALVREFNDKINKALITAQEKINAQINNKKCSICKKSPNVTIFRRKDGVRLRDSICCDNFAKEIQKKLYEIF